MSSAVTCYPWNRYLRNRRTGTRFPPKKWSYATSKAKTCVCRWRVCRKGTAGYWNTSTLKDSAWRKLDASWVCPSRGYAVCTPNPSNCCENSFVRLWVWEPIGPPQPFLEPSDNCSAMVDPIVSKTAVKPLDSATEQGAAGPSKVGESKFDKVRTRLQEEQAAQV